MKMMMVFVYEFIFLSASGFLVGKIDGLNVKENIDTLVIYHSHYYNINMIKLISHHSKLSPLCKTIRTPSPMSFCTNKPKTTPSISEDGAS